MLAIGLRLLAGVFQLLDELDRGFTASSLLGRFVSPITATIGLLTIGLALLLVLSPPGSISMRSNRVATALVGFVAALGVLGVLNEFVYTLGTWQQRFARVSQEILIATLLSATAWWILSNFNADR